MRIFAFYTNADGINTYDEFRLIQLWRESWTRAGFEPEVLCEWHARRHPYFEEYNAAVSKLPTVNNPIYEIACYWRWLAVCAVSQETDHVVMTDYDCHAYGSTFPLEAPDKLNCYQKCIPSVVSGRPHHFLEQARRFAAYKLRDTDKWGDGRSHISDMYILEHNMADEPQHYRELFIVKNHGEPGWETAPAVHFCNYSMQGKQPRWQHIPKLR
jgi:hypothetical protein